MKELSSFSVKWKVVALVLLVAIVAQLIPTQFADFVWTKVKAAEEVIIDTNTCDSSDCIIEPSDQFNSFESTTQKELAINGELKDLRTQNSKTYRLSDGSFYCTSFNYPIHVSRDNKWIDIDNTLMITEDGNRIVNTNGTFNISFPRTWHSDCDNDADNRISISSAHGAISYNLTVPTANQNNLTESLAELSNISKSSNEGSISSFKNIEKLPNLTSGLRYKGIAEEIYLEYIVNPGGIKENIYLESPLPIESLEEGFIYLFDVENLTPELVNNHILFNDIAGKTVYSFSAPLMYDSAGNISDGLTLSIATDYSSDERTKIILLADQEWLLSPDRVYPVVIDPVVTSEGGAIIDTVASYYSSGNALPGMAIVGNGTRSFIKFNWPDLPSYALPVETVVSCYPDATYYDGLISARAIMEDWNISTFLSGVPDLSEYPFQMFEHTFDRDPLSINVSTEAQKYYLFNQNYGIVIDCDNLSVGQTLFSTIETDNPVLSIRYINYQGLEDQWNTHAASVSDMSGTIYVKDALGDFVYIHDDLTTPGDILPISVSHIFNLTEGNNEYGYGYGFRLSLLRTLVYNSDIDSYIYTDEDGTKHYFLLQGSTDYSLEEDPSVKVKTENSVPYIIWPDGSRLTFSSPYNNVSDVTKYEDYRGLEQTFQYSFISGRKLMTKAIDGAGNYLQFNYNSSGMLISMNVNGSAVRQLSFTYDSNKLSRITYPDSSYTQFYSTSRTVNGTSYYYPKRIVDPSGVMMRVAVSSGTLRVSKVYKKAAGSGDSTVVDAEYATFEYEPSRTTVKYGFGTQQMYSEIISFDYYGRAVNAVDDKGNVVIIDYDDNNNVFNNINKSHTELTAGPNYLKNSSFEYSALQYWGLYGGMSSAVKTTSYNFNGLVFGSNSLKLSSYQISGYTGYAQELSLSEGLYTASVYCNASSGTGTGGAVIVFIYNDVNNVTHTFSSIPEKWDSRIQVTFNVPEGAVSQRIFLGTYNYTGSIYFDAVQLEEGGRASYYNGVENGGALYSTGGNWSGDIARTTTTGRSGYVLRIDGAYSSSKYASQQINISKTNTDKQYIRISGWYKAPSYFNDRNAYIQVSFYNASGSIISGKSKTVYPDNNLTGWQYLTESFSVDFEFSYAKIWLNNYGQGYVYFDDVSLTAETSYEDFNSDAEYTYDQFGWLETEISPDRSVTEYTYCTDSLSSLFGQVTQTELTDKYGNVTSTQYYYTGYFDNIFDLSSTVTVYTPADDDLESVTTLTEYKYGSTYNLLPNYLGHPTSIVTKVSEGNNAYKLTECNTTVYDTDTMLPESETDIWNNTTEYSYNSYGELTAVTENGTATTYTYDSVGRITGTTGKARVGTSNNSTVSVSFAYNSGKISTITRTNSYYGFAYDSLGRPLTVTVNRTYGGNTSTTAIASYTYSSSNGLVSRLTYGNGKYKDYSYNTSGQVTAIDYSGTTGIDYSNAYSNAGDVITRYNSLDSLTKSYSYDWLGRPVYTSFSNGRSLKYTYLDKNSESTVTFRGLASQPDKFTYKSYPAERYAKTTVSGNVTAYSFRYADEYGRLSNIDIGDNNYRLKTSYSYLSAGTYIENGTYTSFDKLSGRIGTVSYLKETVSSGATDNISGLPTLTYTYDAKGNIETISEGGILKVKYYYDAQNQLIREDNKYLNNGTGYTVEYRYNADGNMTAKLLYTYTTNSTFPTNPLSTINMGYSASNGWRDQMTSYNGNTITYDGAGNMLSYNNGAAMTLTWTQGNRLATITRGSTQCSFVYDESGYRTKKTVGSTIYTYTWDGSRLVSQDTGTAGSEIVFLYDDSGNMFGFRKADNIYYYANNLQGDVIAIFEITENDIDVVAKYIYDSWGRVLSVTGSQASTIGAENPIRYRSYYYDSETGLYYLKSRYYDPAINRFMSADEQLSIGNDITGLHLFEYCGNNPVNRADFNGNHWYYLWIDDLLDAINNLMASTSNIVYGRAAYERSFYDSKGASDLWNSRPFQNTKPSKEMQLFTEFMYDHDFAADVSVSVSLTKSPIYVKAGVSKVLSLNKNIDASYIHLGAGISTPTLWPVNVTWSFGLVNGVKVKEHYEGFFEDIGGGITYGFDYCWWRKDTSAYSLTFGSSYGGYFGLDYYWLIQ